MNAFPSHQGLKGGANENSLKAIIAGLLPGKYGIGSGTVIDRNGKESRQCDIIIFDKTIYPSYLSLSSVEIYPVDLVYATIEIKTTLDKAAAEAAIENIKSVRDLDYIKDEFASWEGKSEDMLASLNMRKPTPPLGFVFAYNSTTNDAATFANWFDKCGQKKSLLPFMSCVLSLGLVKFQSLTPSESESYKFLGFPSMDDQGRYIASPVPLPSHVVNGVSCPFARMNGKFSPVDESRVLLAFLTILTEALIVKKINPDIHFSSTYFKDLLRYVVS